MNLRLLTIPVVCLVALGVVQVLTDAHPVFAQDLPHRTRAVVMVNSTDDAPDADLDDGICDADDETGGLQCTLRAAIQIANRNPGSDFIQFDLSGPEPFIFQPASPLPRITDPLEIDGYSQSGAAENTSIDGFNGVLLIELDGSLLDINDAYGLHISADNCTVKGLVIHSFVKGGSNGLRVDKDDNTIQGNLIGTDPTGTIKLRNQIGILIINGSNNLIGGTTPSTRNVISGNGNGVVIEGVSAVNNRVQGNLIGTDVSGTLELGNGFGVKILRGQDNLIGGTIPGAGNVISGNGTAGVEIDGDLAAGKAAMGNLIQGNLIGTDVSGTLDLGNIIGVHIDNAVGNLVGGTVAAARNIISGNSSDGIRIEKAAPDNLIQGNYIGTDFTGSVALGNDDDGIEVQIKHNQIGGTTPGAGNLIAASGRFGLSINADSVIIQGNYIGTDASGSFPIGNVDNGVLINGAFNQIGGTTPGAGNLISGNGDDGIDICCDPGNIIQGNLVGTDASGTYAIANDDDGIQIRWQSNQIGGTTPGAGNIISGNGDNGLELAADSLIIQGNYIGTDITGTLDLGNDDDGIDLEGAFHQIGGTTPGAGNIISGNGDDGIDICCDPGHLIQGNLIGTDITGTIALGNDDGGIELGGGNVIDGAFNQIGGITPGAGNIIAANGHHGLELWSFAQSVLVQGNLIGTDTTGTIDLGNRDAGILVQETSGARLEGNTIAYNGMDGIRVVSGTGNRLQTNALFANEGLGINLDEDDDEDTFDEVLRNDEGDTDTGANNLQNTPEVLFSSIPTVVATDSTVIAGRLRSTPNTSFHLELFSNSFAGTTRYWQAETFLDSLDVMTDNNGEVHFNLTIEGDHDAITATATDTAGNTSELAYVFVVNSSGDAPDADVFSVGCDTGNTILRNNVPEAECTLRAAIEQTNELVRPDEIDFDIPGVGVHTIQPHTPLEAIRDTVILDGYTQPGAAPNTDPEGFDATLLINLDGFELVGPNAGLKLEAAGSIIQGLVIGGFGDSGVMIVGASATDNSIQGNIIGLNADGESNNGNDLFGLVIEGAPGNTIGGTEPETRNIISGNGGLDATGGGLWVRDSTATGNVIQGNFIGTDRLGLIADENVTRNRNGPGIFIDGAPNTTIGGTDEGAFNVISGNERGGLWIKGTTARDNVVEGNLIGTGGGAVDDLGKPTKGNRGIGVLIETAPANRIGGTTDGAGNLISGNDSSGVFITGLEATGNLVQGNLIGTDSTGTVDVGNGYDGVTVLEAPGNTIGGPEASARNLISGNDSSGVRIAGLEADGNTVQGNAIGTDSTGMAALANAGDGLFIDNAPNTVGGGTGANAGNLISGNAGRGVMISGSGASGALLLGNRIGTDVGGTLPLGNGRSGVEIVETPSTTIGGLADGAGNIIGASVQDGLRISGDAAGSHTIRGNFIGTHPGDAGDAGKRVLATLGNAGDGIALVGSPDNTVVSNTIGNNAGDGLSIREQTATGNIIRHNIIGTDTTGTVRLGNTHGILIVNASNNVIGGENENDGNTIAFNTRDGVRLVNALNTPVQGNALYRNDGLGINLDNDGDPDTRDTVTENDELDEDEGANHLQNYPTLEIVNAGGQGQVHGALDSHPGANYRIELFANTMADPEGEEPLGSLMVVTNAQGFADFTFAVADTVENVTATATDTNGNTSELSAPATPLFEADLVLEKTVTPLAAAVGDTVRFLVSIYNKGPHKAQGVSVTDVLPGGITFLDATAGRGTYTGTVWTIGEVTVADTLVLALAVRLNQDDPLTNTASITASDQEDPDTENNTASATVNALTADLALRKTADRMVVAVGDTVTFTVKAFNVGPDEGTSVSVADAAPAGMTFVDVMPEQGAYDDLTGVWTVGSLAVGDSTMLTIKAQVDTAGPLTNTATISTPDQVDPFAANNTASATINDETINLARLQLIHAMAHPDLAAIDIYLDGARILDDFAFRSATGLLFLTGAPHTLALAPDTSASDADAFFSEVIMLSIGRLHLGLLFDDGAEGATLVLEEDVPSASTIAAEVDLALYHGVTDAPALEARLFEGTSGQGSLLFNEVPFGEPAVGYLSFDPTLHTFEYLFADTDVVGGAASVNLFEWAGEAAVLIATGLRMPPVGMEITHGFNVMVVLRDGTVLPGTRAPQQAAATVAEDWNLVGLPLTSNDANYLSLFPEAETASLFGYEGRYTTPDPPVLTPGMGYWLRFDQAGGALFEGPTITVLAVALTEGWNLFAGPNCAVPAVQIEDPGGVLLPGTLFGYAGGYVPAEEIEATRGYWGRAGADGTVLLDCAVLAAKGATGADEPLAGFGALVVSDATGAEQRLYFGGSLPMGTDRRAYTRPPRAPGRLFRASFEKERYVTDEDDAVMVLNDAAYPLLVEIETLPIEDSYTLEVSTPNRLVATKPLAAGLALSIEDPDVTHLRLIKGTSGGTDLPQAFVLDQNYPNPFNPSTTIRFGLPETARVTLEVFDVLGRRVSVLKEAESLDAGWHSAFFDTQGLGSGVYLYRLQAGTFVAARRLLLVK